MIDREEQLVWTGLAGSTLTHLLAVGAICLLAFRSVEPARFSGRSSQVGVIRLQFSAPAVEPAAVEFQTESPEPLVAKQPADAPFQPQPTDPPAVTVEPQKTVIDSRSFVRTETGEVPTEELLEAWIDHHAARQLRLPRRPPEPTDRPRTPSSNPPKSELQRQSRVSVMPSMAVIVPRVDIAGSEETPPDFSAFQNQPFDYPAQALENHWFGTVKLSLEIDPTGRVTDVQVERSSGYPVLDAEAVSTLRTWRARPAQRGGQAVATRKTIEIRFKPRTRTGR